MKKIFPVLLAGLMGIMMCGCHVEYAPEITSPEETTEAPKEYTIRFRYDDKNYEEYFKYCADVFERDNSDTHIVLDYVETDTYIQDILNDTTEHKQLPDVYIADDSDLGTLYMLGLAAPTELVTESNYGLGAINACTYLDKIVAYPLSFATTVLVYNKDFLSEKEVADFEALKTFSDDADFTDEGIMLEGIFKCDVNKLFLNYGFLGAGLNIGGVHGDDKEQFSVSSSEAIANALEYIAVTDYFSVNSDLSVDDCFDKLQSVKILATILPTDMLAKLEETEINYGIVAFPDYDEEMNTTPLAVSKAIAVNPFSESAEKATQFAELVSSKCADKLYALTGTFSSRKNVKYEQEELANAYASYDKSIAKNRLQYGEQVYALLEIAMHNIISGNDPEDELTAVNNYMISQIQ